MLRSCTTEFLDLNDVLGPSRPNLHVGLEAFDHQIPLGLVLPEIPEKLFLVGIVLPYTLKTPLNKPLDVSGVEGRYILGSVGKLLLMPLMTEGKAPLTHKITPTGENPPLGGCGVRTATR